MSSENKVKETLSKKLSEKKAPKKIETKAEKAENKLKLLNEIKYKEKSIRIPKNNEKEASVKLKNLKNRSSTIKSDLSKNKNFKAATKEATEQQNTKCMDDKKSSLEVLKSKPIKAPKISNKTKSVIKSDEEPCSNKKIKQDLPNERWEPANWQIILENIRKMRSNDKAPVDTMGCHKCADENADEKTQRYHKLVALMLSSQTKDETTYHAMLRLRERNLTPEVICDMKVNVLENTLHPVSFYKNKAKYLQQTAKILVDKYNSDIPNNIKELVALPGVGPKMAHICMATAWHEVTGIGVDVHVHRISNRIGWLQKSTKEPEQTRLALEAWLPQQLWSEVNHLLVGFGQTVCTPVKPKCNQCLNCEICPSAIQVVKKI